MKIVLSLFPCFLFFASCAQPQKQSEGKKLIEMVDSSWTEKVVKSDADWKKLLSSEEYEITRNMGTERPYSSEFYNNHEKGMYYCLCCGNPLFSSENKFESGTGWPSYWKPFSLRSVKTSSDNSLGMERNEISCMRCGAHLGHVFDDGPKPTGLRYCVDGVALKFKKSPGSK